MLSPPQPPKAEQVKELQWKVPSDARVDLKLFVMLWIAANAGKEMDEIRDLEPPQQG